MNTLIARLRSLPRAARWLAGFVAFLAIYFGVVEPAIALMNDWNERADRIEAQSRATANVAESLASTAAEIERQVVAIGKARPPSTSSDPQAALDGCLTKIVSRREIVERRRNVRAASTLTLNGVRTLSGDPLPKIERLQIEWQIDCDTTKLMAVMKDLELAPEVHSVSSVQIRKSTESRAEASGILSVTFYVETWYVPRPGTTPPGSAMRDRSQGAGA
jgi:hypothetical protein